MSRALFIGLNPSVADASRDDNTSKKWSGFSRRWGHTDGAHEAALSECGRYRHWLTRPGYLAVNLSDFRSTKPKGLLDAVEAGVAIESAANTTFIIRGALLSDVVVACWGGPYGSKPLQRVIAALAERVLFQLRESGIKVMCFGQTKDGHPRHPLMLAYDTPLRPMVMP